MFLTANYIKYSLTPSGILEEMIVAVWCKRDLNSVYDRLLRNTKH